MRLRLSVVMFAFYFGLGAWVITFSTFLMSAPVKGGLNFTTTEVGLIYSAFAFGGVIAPLLIGLLTDQFFRAELVLGVASLVSAGLLYAVALQCETHFPIIDAAYRTSAAGQIVDGQPALEQLDRYNRGVVPEADRERVREEVRLALDRVNDDPAVRGASRAAFLPILLLMMAFAVCMQLCMTVINVITLRNLPDPFRSFSRVRLFGTVGWIAAGNAIGLFLRPVSVDVLYLGAVSAVLVGFYGFTLPATPPKGMGRSILEAFGFPALRLFRDRSFVVFVAVAFLATILNQFYVVYAHRFLTDLGIARPEQVMTVAQVVEVACMFLIPILRPNDWMKPLMALGLAGYALRGVVLSAGWIPGVLALGVPMHGWGYAFFFVVGATYLDREAPRRLRASAQGIITFIASGLGVWSGNTISGWVVERNRLGTIIDWRSVWEIPMIGGLAVLIGFVWLFHPPPAPQPDEPPH